MSVLLCCSCTGSVVTPTTTQWGGHHLLLAVHAAGVTEEIAACVEHETTSLSPLCVMVLTQECKHLVSCPVLCV